MLMRLRKDTYGVFSETVDLDELPDYLDVIEHPMDFGTVVKKKLSNGAYGSLELFEVGSILKGKHIKKHLALDENRRNTYKQFHPSAGGRVFGIEFPLYFTMIKLTMVVTHAPCPCAWFGVASQTTQPGFKPHNGGLGICASRE
uniref:Bromo domain-containing protein n=1 Tax=Salix viminalis TaxID=40686 RepID=A0A6N2L5K9_SALVM